VRYKGQCDGIHVDPKSGKLLIHENKTTARITEDWKASFIMSHQITAYALYASVLTGIPVNTARVLGCALPLPKASPEIKGLCNEVVMREVDAHDRFFGWVLARYQDVIQYEVSPVDIPMSTCSCNRFFRTCSFMSYCYTEREDRLDMFNEELVDSHWEPLDGFTTGE